jgi:hypothetical protein
MIHHCSFHDSAYETSLTHLYDRSWKLPVGCEQPPLEAIRRDAELPEAVGCIPRALTTRPVGTKETANAGSDRLCYNYFKIMESCVL